MTDNTTAEQVAVELAGLIARRIELIRGEGERLDTKLFRDLVDDDLNVQRLIALDSAATTLAGALDWLRKTLGVRVGELLEGGSVQIGEELISYRPTKRRRVLDRTAFVEWLGGDYARVVSMPSTGGKITAVRTIARERGLNPDTVEATFFENVLGEPKLTYTPMEIVEAVR